jgi:hypothetical protein
MWGSVFQYAYIKLNIKRTKYGYIDILYRILRIEQ